MMVAEAWPPELPPVSISMGMNRVSAALVSTTLAARASSKDEMIPLVKVAEIIKNSSQGARLRQVAHTVVFR